MSVKDALDLVKKNKVEIVDFKFVDVPGLWQHFSVPAAELTADLFEDGIGLRILLCKRIAGDAVVIEKLLDLHEGSGFRRESEDS